ncbi:hypothetical protein CULTSU28_18400 [Corynebacterium ulcerans]|nr:hypothetical protein CULTSU28_18400 [Corynebacterium ulcerans]
MMPYPVGVGVVLRLSFFLCTHIKNPGRQGVFPRVFKRLAGVKPFS